MAREVIDLVPADVEHGESRLAMSYEKWWSWDHEGKSEWVDGEVIVFMPASVLHGKIVAFLTTLLSQFARWHDLGVVLPDTIEMRLGNVSRVPDVLFVAREHLDRLTPKRLVGPADLVVEVVSDDSVARDREEKFREYAAAGVPEYWLIDARPEHRGAEFYRLVDGAYQAVPADADGRYRSGALPGFWLRPNWLLRDPLPDPWTLMALIAPGAARAALAALGGDGDADPA